MKNKEDLVVNYWSPTIGRAGAGHFAPVAGYDPSTDRVLLDEVNPNASGSYWVAVPLLLKSMMGPNGDRGFITIELEGASR